MFVFCWTALTQHRYYNGWCGSVKSKKQCVWDSQETSCLPGKEMNSPKRGTMFPAIPNAAHKKPAWRITLVRPVKCLICYPAVLAASAAGY